jgi:hypothetical protein
MNLAELQRIRLRIGHVYVPVLEEDGEPEALPADAVDPFRAPEMRSTRDDCSLGEVRPDVGVIAHIVDDPWFQVDIPENCVRADGLDLTSVGLH